MDKQLGIFDPCNAAAVKQGREDGGRNGSKASKAKSGAKGGAAGKGVKKRPRMSATEQGLCSRGCGKWGVVGAKHSTWSKEEGKAVACGRFTAAD